MPGMPPVKPYPKGAPMSRKTPTVVPLAAALAALGGTVATATAEAALESATVAAETTEHAAVKPNGFMTMGEDILGFMVTQGEDGTVLAQHSSHYSHSSHASHHSSRY